MSEIVLHIQTPGLASMMLLSFICRLPKVLTCRLHTVTQHKQSKINLFGHFCIWYNTWQLFYCYCHSCQWTSTSTAKICL